MPTDDFNSAESNVPRKQLESDRSGDGGSGRRPPRTAVGTGGPDGSDDWGGQIPNQGYLPGQRLKCRIEGVRPGGYDVTIASTGEHAYFRTPAAYPIGTVIEAKFLHYRERRTGT